MPKKFKLKDIVDTAKEISGKVNYPINSADELVRSLGGDQAEVKHEGKGHKVGQARQALPAEYFPIESEEDLITKIGGLRILHGDEPEDVKMGKERTGPSDVGDPPNISESDLPQPRGVPGAGRLKT